VIFNYYVPKSYKLILGTGDNVNLFGWKAKPKAPPHRPLVDPKLQKMREQTHAEWPEMAFKPMKSPGRPSIDRWQAIQLKNSGFSYREVAKIMHVSSSAVYRAVQSSSNINVPGYSQNASERKI
jgi:hypothetical protein